MSSKPTIAIDSYGGETSPDRALAAAAALSLSGRVRVVLVGDASELNTKLSALSYDPAHLRLVDAKTPYPRNTGDHLAAHRALKQTLPVCFQQLLEGEADALVTAAPEQLVWEAAIAHSEPLRPGLEPALAAVIPTVPRSSSDDPFALLLDVSGRSVTDASSLLTWSIFGSTYSRVVSGVRQPQLALLSTGRDRTQGPPAVVEAHQGLQRRGDIQFVGNIHAVDIPRGFADVVVCDGFTGNAVRGVLEGVTQLTVEAARYAWRSKIAWRAGLRLLSSGVGMLRQVSEFQKYGGAPILGLKHLVFVTKEGASQSALENSVRLAAKCVDRQLIASITAALDAAQLERQ